MITIIAIDETAPIPRAGRLTLTCDDPEPAMFKCVASQSFEHPEGFVAQYRMAMRAGWKDTHAFGRRVFLCPGCSGK